MPVVIHEFEVVAEPPPPPAGESATAEAAPPRPAPRDVERVLRLAPRARLTESGQREAAW